MDLEEFALAPQGTGYTQCAKRNFAIKFFSDLSNAPEISRDGWKDLLGIGEQIYYTTFTDDSDYVPNGMDLSALNRFVPELRNRVVTHIRRKGNYIVNHHVDDYLARAA